MMQNGLRSLFTALSMYLVLSVFSAKAQNIVINMAPIDGIPINRDNILNYQVQCTSSIQVQVKGVLRYRGSNLSLSYSFNGSLSPGVNSFNPNSVHPQWQFSSSSLQDLFVNYNTLPSGTYEYCVTITPHTSVPEATVLTFDECLYHKTDELFLINLIDPENKAKLHEYNPMLSWVANYSFSNELTYRIRVAEIKHGQNPQNAVMRNQPVYEERNLIQNSIVYPVYAKPLEPGKQYAWTVDAYFKGILLGGSEVWQFSIPIDTIPQKYPLTRSYIDIKRENGATKLYIPGEMKLKYQLDKSRNDTLNIELVNSKSNQVAIKPQKLGASYGDNRYVLNLKDSCSLKHLNDYTLIVKNKSGEIYKLPFKYVNNDFIH